MGTDANDIMIERGPDVVRRTLDNAQRVALPSAMPAPLEIADDLPPNPDALIALPYGLGLLQKWTEGRSTHPSRAMAGITAFAILSHLTAHISKIDSYIGLGTAENYLVMAPTGAGKEGYRGAFEAIDGHVRSTSRDGENLRSLKLPAISYSLPASMQAMHMALGANRMQTVLADEIGEWFFRAARDDHRQATIGYMLQVYSRQLGKLAPPAAATRGYKAVECPRFTIFGTSTAERMLNVMTAEHAASGVWNRWAMCVAEQHRIPKVYSVAPDPPAELVELANWLLDLPASTVVTFAAEAWMLYQKIDSETAEPLSFSDAMLAGRLSEQAIRMAASIALSDRRTEIDADDLDVAYKIRLGMYRRAAALIGGDGAISGLHMTSRAVEQLTGAFRRHAHIARSHLQSYSRSFRPLSTPERESVIKTLTADGVARVDPDLPGRLISLICKTP